jgi:phospholipid-binding lipoprotein MlaA
MRAIVLETFGGVDSLVYADLPEPEPMAGQVVIEIKGRGMHLARQGKGFWMSMVSAWLRARRRQRGSGGSGVRPGYGRPASPATAAGRRAPVLAASGLALVLALCGAPAAAQDENDPFEPANRAVFQFNHALDGVILEPVARGYRMVTPELFRESVSNVLNNLATPGVLVNDLLQGEFKRAEMTLGRFMINTILGLGGIIDVATWAGMPPRHSEDFGQTLAVYGVGEGPHLVLPLLGPSNPRDAVGRGVDLVLDPFLFLAPGVVQLGRTGAQGVDSREQNIETLEELEKSSIDLYAATRTLSRQHRANEIRNGAPAPLEDIYGDDIDEFDGPEDREAE